MRKVKEFIACEIHSVIILVIAPFYINKFGMFSLEALRIQPDDPKLKSLYKENVPILFIFSGSVSQAKTSKESPLAVKQQFSKLNNLTRTNVKCNNQVQEAAGQSQSQVEGNGATARKQLTPEDHQQLAELVQENMERNHVRQLR